MRVVSEPLITLSMDNQVVLESLEKALKMRQHCERGPRPCAQFGVQFGGAIAFGRMGPEWVLNCLPRAGHTVPSLRV